MPVSKAGIGAIIILLEAGLKFLNVEVPEGSVANAIEGIVGFIGLILLVWGQLDRKDLKGGIIRR